MMSGGSKQGSSSGLDFTSLISGLAGAATGNGGGSSAGNTLAGLGSLAGNFIPGAGLVGAGLGAVVNAFTGKEHVPDGAGLFAGLHSPTLAPIDDAGWFKEDAAVYASYAKALGISVEEVAMGLAYDAKLTNHSPAYVFDAYREVNASNLLNWILAGNKQSSGARIVPGEMGPLKLSVSSVPVLVNVHGSPAIVDLPSKVTGYGNDYAQGVSPGTSIYDAQAAMYSQGVPLGTPIQNSLVASSTNLAGTTGSGGLAFNSAAAQAADKGTLLQQLADAMWKGAKSGATDVLADTDAAKAAKADYFKDFVKDYQLPLAGGGIGLFLLIKKAFFDNA